MNKITSKCIINFIFSILFLIAINLSGCHDEDESVWQYPIKLGDSRQNIQKLIGKPQYIPEGSTIEWFCDSGLSIEFDDYGQASKINFIGPAIPNTIILDGFNWNPTKRKIVNGISVYMKKDEVYKILGTPDYYNESVLQSFDKEQIWRTDKFLIIIEFWKNSEVIRMLSVKRIIN